MIGASQLVAVALLIVLNAAFAGTEMALVSLREGQLRHIERLGPNGQLAARLARDPNRYLATIQIGITLAGFLASATAAVALAEPLVPALRFLGGFAKPAAVVAVTFVLTFLTLVLGELAPKRIAMQHAERWALAAVRPLTLTAAISKPAVWLLGRSSDLVVRFFGGDPHKHREEITPAEIRDLVSAHQGFTPQQRRIMSGAVEITERVLREVLVPRRAVFTIDAGLTVGSAIQALAASGHSRAPVVPDGNLDHAFGVVVLRELVLTDPGRPVTEVMRRPYMQPESLCVAEALRRMMNDREQLTLVVEEHGAVDGIVTLEDLVEEIVGEIYEESDPDVAAARFEPDGSIRLAGAFPVHDLSDLGVEGIDTDGDYTTVAGMLIDRLGRVPTRPGDIVPLGGGWTAEAIRVERHAITRVRLHHPPKAGTPG